MLLLNDDGIASSLYSAAVFDTKYSSKYSEFMEKFTIQFFKIMSTYVVKLIIFDLRIQIQ